jgi:hypothetical protein
MNKKYVYVILDNVSGQYSPLFLESNSRAAQRQFVAFLRGTQYHPSNYDLYSVAAFCQDSTTITDCDRLHIVNGSAIESEVAQMSVFSENKSREEAINYVP